MVNVFLQTYGCSLNHSDSEAMAGILEKASHTITSEEEADVIVINSCTVKSNPEQRLFSQIRTKQKPMVIAGCVPQADPNNTHFANVSVVGPKSLSKIAVAVEETSKGHNVSYLEEVDQERNAFPLVREQDHIGIIPINAGCLSNCSYCKTKHARGNLASYPLAAIEQQFRSLINDGAKEIWLTSQDTATYGLDSKTNVTNLLKKLLEKPGEYRIRLGMANPQYLLPQLDALIEVMQHENIFRFLHLPVQSGSNKVLKDMRRGYTVEQFTTVVQKVTKAIPDITIATDIIVGFPTETEEDFQKTINLIESLHIPVVNISKFYPRPDTLAATMKLLPTHIVKDRSTKLKKVCESIAVKRNESFVGKELSVLIDEPGKKNDTLIARANNYVQVILPNNKGEIGMRMTVTPTHAGTFDVRVKK